MVIDREVAPHFEAIWAQETPPDGIAAGAVRQLGIIIAGQVTHEIGIAELEG